MPELSKNPGNTVIWNASIWKLYNGQWSKLNYSMVHLWSPRDEKILWPVGQKWANQPLWSASGAASCESSEFVPSDESSGTSPSFWISLVTWFSSSLALTSAISPGFLSNSPLNCFRAFFSTSYKYIDICVRIKS